MLSVEDQARIREIEPSIEAAHAEHMQRIKTTPINPVRKLAELTEEAQDPLLYGPILRNSYTARMEWFEEQGVDARGLLASAFLVNLLTEDNLPHYSIVNYRAAQTSEPLLAWLHQWITEEDAHGEMMRDYGLLTGMIGNEIPHESYYQGRVSQLTNGIDIVIQSPAQGFAYLTLQEKVTGISHKRTGLVLDELGRRMLQSVSGDEERHHRFYSAQTNALLDSDPDTTVIGIRDQFTEFHMPGVLGIPGFDAMARTIALAGIFDREIEADAKHKLITREWKIDKHSFSSDEAKQAQEELLTAYDPNGEEQKKRASQMARLRERFINRGTTEDGLRPFVLGYTVILDQQTGVLVR